MQRSVSCILDPAIQKPERPAKSSISLANFSDELCFLVIITGRLIRGRQRRPLCSWETEGLGSKAKSRQLENSDRMLPAAHVFQRSEVTSFEAVIYNPVICLILQGSKVMTVGQQVVEPMKVICFASHDLPVTSKIKQASAKRPYRALIFSLDLGILRGLYLLARSPKWILERHSLARPIQHARSRWCAIWI